MKQHEEMNMRRFIITAAIVLAVLPLAAQTTEKTDIMVSGTCAAGVKRVYLGDTQRQSTRIDSVDVYDGKFTLKAQGTRDNFYTLIQKLDDNGMSSGTYAIAFVCDGAPITVDFNDMSLKGSPLNERFNTYDRADNDNYRDFFAGYMRYSTLLADTTLTAERRAELRKKMEDELIPVQDKIIENNRKAYEENKDNVLGAYFLAQASSDMEYDELKEALNDKYAYVNHPILAGARTNLKFMEKKNAIIGKQFTDLTEADTAGVAHRLSEYVGRGNYVLIDFWASWCGPCMSEMPNVKANYEKYHPKGFEIVGLSFDQKKESWVKAIETKELGWIHLSDLKGWRSVAAQTYGINSIPSSLLVDPQGKVVASDLRGPDLGAKLAEIYGE